MFKFLLKLFSRKSNLDRLIAKADKFFKESGKQYFVMPTRKINDPKYDKTLIVVHGKTFLDNYNRVARRTNKKQMSYMDMCNQCVYKTSPGTTLKR